MTFSHILLCCELKALAGMGAAGHFQGSSEMLDWVRVRVLAGPLKDTELRVIGMFTVHLLHILGSSKHDGLNPEWWFYRTRGSCLSQAQEVVSIWGLLRSSL